MNESDNKLISQLISDGNFSDALNKVQELLKTEPKNISLLLDAGFIHTNINQFDQAVDFYNQVVALVPESASGYTGLGFVHKKQGKLNEAIGFFQQAIEHAPDNAMVHYELGEVFLEMDQYDAAIKNYYKAIQFGGAETESETLHRIAQAHLGLNDPDKAIEVAKNALSRDPGLSSTLMILTAAETMKENWNTAKQYIEQYIKEVPGDENAVEMLQHISEHL